MDLGPVLLGERDEGQRVNLGAVHEGGKYWRPEVELVGDAAPLLAGRGIVTVTGSGGRAEGRNTGGMKRPPKPHYRHRFPAEIISQAVWLYHAFSLSLDVELLLAERGTGVSYETVQRWCIKFGQNFAECLRRRRPRPGDKWHVDEVFIRIHGVQHYLWRAVDQHGFVLDILVQPQRGAGAATRFFRRPLKDWGYVPRVIVTDTLRSYGVAQRQLLPSVEHRKSRYPNNRAENSHRTTRRRERKRCGGDIWRMTSDP